jgi:ArsR family transcriptional regulator
MDPNEMARLKARADILKALGHPTRLMIVEELGKGERCVCQFVEMIDADFSTVSKHLAILRQAGLVGVEKRGQQVFCHLKVPCVLRFMECIHSVVQSNAEIAVELVRY